MDGRSTVVKLQATVLISLSHTTYCRYVVTSDRNRAPEAQLSRCLLGRSSFEWPRCCVISHFIDACGSACEYLLRLSWQAPRQMWKALQWLNGCSAWSGAWTRKRPLSISLQTRL